MRLIVERGDEFDGCVGNADREHHTKECCDQSRRQRDEDDIEPHLIFLFEDDLGRDGADDIPVIAAGRDRRQIVVVEHSRCILSGNAELNIRRELLTGFFQLIRGIDHLIVAVCQTDGHLGHIFRIIEHAFELRGIERDDEQRVFVDLLDIIDPLEVIGIAGGPAVRGALLGDHRMEIVKEPVSEQFDRAVGHFADRVIIAVHDRIIDEVFHDTQAEKLIGDDFFGIERLIFVMVGVGRIISIGGIGCESERRRGFHA